MASKGVFPNKLQFQTIFPQICLQEETQSWDMMMMVQLINAKAWWWADKSKAKLSFELLSK